MSNMIANRYEVIQHIGQGGMADVFLAVDTILNRQVAVKIMRGELCTDEVSVLRFEREAQAATSLNHPNIVEVYDVGEYKGHHFIVMEYVPGKTLKQVIKDRGALTKEETVDIMKQLVSATAEAHKRGIIHRDIKPQNVIVKADGSIKMVDFGIALAKGSMQLTQANNVMGSVHYLAPELARGNAATVQSDIYALGIVMYEMLSGDVPYKADNAVQVALMHMRNEMPSIRNINPEIPQSIDNCIIRATAKNPAMRYRSCNDMLADLSTCLRPERANERKIILAETEDEEIKAVQSSKPARKAAVKQNTVKEEPEEQVFRPAVQRPAKKKRGLLITMIVLLICLGLAGVYFALNQSGFFKEEVKQVAVPDITGVTMAEAKNICLDNNLVLDTSNVTYTLTESTEKGQIIAVSPEVGTLVDPETTLTVTVSSGIGVTTKDYVGMNIKDAQSDLAQYSSMKVDAVEEENTDVDPGTVIRQELLAPGTQFNPETADEIRLVYAAYPTITIPNDMQGKTIDEATAELEALGVQVRISNLDTTALTEEEIANLETGVVIKCDPDIGSEYTQKEDNYVILYYY